MSRIVSCAFNKKHIFCDAVAWSLRTAVYAGRPCLHEVHHLAGETPAIPAEGNAGACHRHVLHQKKNRQLLQQDVAPIVTILPVQAALVAAKTALISICAKNKYGEP